MPRYAIELQSPGVGRVHDAIRLAAQRFPEVEVEPDAAVESGRGTPLTWTCRAPSAAHVDRWATAARLPVRSVHRIDDDYPEKDPR